MMSEEINPVRWTPIPDPTARTTEQLHREISGAREIIETRLDGMDERRAEGLRNLEIRLAHDATYAKTAVDVALAAQKDATNKSEASFAKQLEGIVTLLNSTKEAVNSQINDISARITRSEAATTTTKEVKSETQMSIGAVVGVIGCVVGILGLLVASFVGLSSSIHYGSTGTVTLQQPVATGGADTGSH
jgi:hypothetical protein